MTSNKSSAKSPVLSVLRTQLYSARMLLALFGLILLAAPALLTMGGLSSWYYRDAEINIILGNVQSFIIATGLIPLLILAFVLALFEFGYLHKKQKLDYFHALPVRRADHYLGRALAALAALIGGSVLAGLGQTIGIAVTIGTRFPEVYGVTWFCVLMMVFASFAAYVFTVMIIALTSTLWEMIFSFLAVSAAWPVTAFLTQVIVDFSIPISDFKTDWLSVSVFSPYLSAFFSLVSIDREYCRGVRIAYCFLGLLLVQIAVCGALGYWFFCKRKSEFSENVAVTRFSRVVQFIASMLGAFCGSMILLWIMNNYAGYLLGAVLGAAVAWIVAELLYTHSLKKLLKNSAVSAGGLAVFAVVNVLIAFGLIGVPHLPELENINAVSVNGRKWESYGGSTDFGYQELGYGTVYTQSGDHYVEMGSFDDKAVENGLELAEQMLAIQKARYYPYHPIRFGRANTWDIGVATEESVQLDVNLRLFTTDGGVKHYGLYDVWEGDGETLFNDAAAIVTTPEYIESSVALNYFDILDEFILTDYDGSNDRVYRFDDLPDPEAAVEKLKAAYLADLTGVTRDYAATNDTTYTLLLKSHEPITLKGGILDSELPAAGLECWVSPESVPGYDPDMPVSGVDNSRVMVYSGNHPNLAAAFDELAKELDALEK